MVLGMTSPPPFDSCSSLGASCSLFFSHKVARALSLFPLSTLAGHRKFMSGFSLQDRLFLYKENNAQTP